MGNSPLVSSPSSPPGEAADDSCEVVSGWVGVAGAGFAARAGRGPWVKGKVGRESWISVTSWVLASHMVKFGFVAELDDQGDPGLASGGQGGAEEFSAMTFHCIETDNVVLGAPGGE